MKTYYKIILSLFIIFLNYGNLAAKKASYYKVIKGDSLYKISKKFYGAGIKWTNVYKLNAEIIKSPDLIYPSQQFILKGIYYKVKKGDSLYNISQKLYETPAYWKKIYKINSRFINTPGLIYPGQVFFVPESETIPAKPKSVQESAELLKEIPFPEKFEPIKIILSRRIINKELDDFLPPQLSSEDFDGVEIYAGVELENKKHKDRKLYITVCDIGNLPKKEDFWPRIKKKIEEFEEVKGKIKSFNTVKLEGFSFEVTPDKFTFLKKKEKPEIITILKTKIEHEEDISIFTELFSSKEGILKNKKIKEKIFLLPVSLPSGFRFLEFYLEKIPAEYIKEKPKAEWTKKMIGKLNLAAVYVDKLGQKEILTQLAKSLQIDKILKKR